VAGLGTDYGCRKGCGSLDLLFGHAADYGPYLSACMCAKPQNLEGFEVFIASLMKTKAF